MLVRIVRRNVVHGLHATSDTDVEVEQHRGNMQAVVNDAMASAKKKSKRDKSSYYGTEVWHEHLESWVSRTFYYNGYPISSRGSI